MVTLWIAIIFVIPKTVYMFKLSNALPILCAAALLMASCQKDVLPDENSVPKVEAGASQTIVVDSASLSGSATDSDGVVVAYLWSQISGPNQASIINNGSATTKVKNLVTGTYLFQLMATDNKGATGVDTVSVKANIPAALKTLTLQPLKNPDEYQLVYYLASNFWSGGEEFAMEGWTKNSDPMNVRHVVKFDLSTIPAGAKIESAELYLYSNPAPISGNITEANTGGANGFFVRQITTAWTQSSITWNNPPVVSTTTQAYVPHTNDKFKDVVIDLKGSVASMVANNANYGWYFKLENEVTYTARIFVGSHSDKFPAKAPKLVVTYK